MNIKLIIVLILVAIIVCYYFMGQKASYQGKQYTVFGTTWCGYTTKQREYLDNKYGKGSHKFVDCDSGDCGGIEAFPVTETPSGERVKGFNESI